MEAALTEKITQIIIATPQLLILLIFSFFNGHLYAFIITTYIKKNDKGNNELSNSLGKVVLGVLVHGVVLLPNYLIKYKCFPNNYENILELILPTIFIVVILSLVLLIIFLHKGAKNG